MKKAWKILALLIFGFPLSIFSQSFDNVPSLSPIQGFSKPGVFEETPEEELEGVPSGVPGGIPRETPGGMPGRIPGKAPGRVSICPPPVVEEGKCPAVSGKEMIEKKENEAKEKETEEKESQEIYKIKEVSFERGQEVSGVYYYVSPEKTTFVKMSAVDINRIVCPIDVQDVVFSEEKGIKVHVSGRNVFVKFLVKKIDENIEYSSTPVDIHVVCNNKVFSIIAFPEKIPATLVYLEDKELELKEKLSREESFEELLLSLVRDVFKGKIPAGAEYKVVDKTYNLFKDLVVKEKANYVLDGEGLNVRFFVVKYTGETQGVDLNEKLFLKTELTKAPVAISLGKLHLLKGEETELVIVEKKILWSKDEEVE